VWFSSKLSDAKRARNLKRGKKKRGVEEIDG